MTGSCGLLCRAVNALALLQEAQQQALTSLRALVAVMARSSPQAQPPPLPTPVASQLLDCLNQALQRLAPQPELQAQSPKIEVPGLELAAADQAAAYNTAQVLPADPCCHCLQLVSLAMHHT